MKLGYKIRKIRELKNITPKDMADRLDITTGGYSKIERDEVTINLERLEEIAAIFDMKPEEVMAFDEKVVFNNSGEIKGQYGSHNIQNCFPEDLKRLYEENAKLQADKIKLLEDKIKYLEEKK